MHDGGLPVEGDLRQEPGIARCGRICRLDVPWKWLSERNHCLHATSCTRTEWSFLTHNRVVHQVLARSLRGGEFQFVIEDTWVISTAFECEQQRGPNPSRTGVTTEKAGSILRQQSSTRGQKALLLGITIANPCASSNLENAARHARKRLAARGRTR